MTGNMSKFYRTFSGTDSLVFLLFPKTPPINLGCLTTITYSTYRDKKPVNTLGRINIKGFTRGTRIVAGTMIFTVINQHFVNEILEKLPWLNTGYKLKADELPLFDIMIVSANEYGSSVDMMIYGVDITDEAQVMSIEDLFTENQLSFIARDVDVLREYKPTANNDKTNESRRISTFGYMNVML
jgi:hypothetical protein